MSDQQSHKRVSEFENYFSKQASDADKQAFQDSLEEGSFEAEALEGFKSIENDAAALAAMRDIQKRVAEKTGLKKERKIVFPIWKSLGIAAAVAFFVVSGFFITNWMENEETVAQNSEKSVPSFVPDSFEDVELNEDKVSEELEEELDSQISLDVVAEPEVQAPLDEKILADQFSREKEESASKKNLDRTPKVAEPDLMVEDDEMEEDAAVEYDVNPSPTTTINAKTVENRATSSNVPTTVAPAEMESLDEVSQTSVNSVSYYEIGKNNYNAKKYSEAINNFQNSLDNSQRVVESQYYTAMSYYNMNKNNKALKYFDMVVGNSGSPLRFNAMWYKAIILEEKGDKSGAKLLLQQLANGNSGFKNQAADKLSKMD